MAGAKSKPEPTVTYVACVGISFADGTRVEPGEVVEPDRFEPWMIEDGTVRVPDPEPEPDGAPTPDVPEPSTDGEG